MKVTLYRVYPSVLTDGKYGYSLTEPGPGTDLIYDECEYDLPEGYTIAQNANGQDMIFDPDGEGCELIGRRDEEIVALMTTKRWTKMTVTKVKGEA